MSEEGEEEEEEDAEEEEDTEGTSLLTGTKRVKAAAQKDPRMPLDGGNLKKRERQKFE